VDATLRFAYEVLFENKYLALKGDAFQDFFSSLMEKRYPADFQRMRAWGRTGDRKNDGYLKSTRTVFQCYAPNELEASVTVQKIREDFSGAIEHWNPRMARWTFVHNSRQGLGPDVLAVLLELNDADNGVVVSQWGFEELRRVAMQLAATDLASLLGPAPSSSDFRELGFADLRPVLEAVEIVELHDDSPVRPVPPRKLEHNRLSPEIEEILRRGMVRSDLVRSYFDSGPDPTRPDRIARSIRQHYDEQSAMGKGPDAIFFELQAFVGGSQRATAKREAASYAVLAFFFEQCDIFERPPEIVT